MSDKQQQQQEHYLRNPSFYTGEGTTSTPPHAAIPVWQTTQMYAAGGAPYAPSMQQPYSAVPFQQQQQQQQYPAYAGNAAVMATTHQQYPVIVDVQPGAADYRHYVVGHQPHDYEEHLGCARLGCLLSWIPLIGLLSFLFNIRAPRGSRRRRLAWISLFVAILMVGSSMGIIFFLYYAAFITAANH